MLLIPRVRFAGLHCSATSATPEKDKHCVLYLVFSLIFSLTYTAQNELLKLESENYLKKGKKGPVATSLTAGCI